MSNIFAGCFDSFDEDVAALAAAPFERPLAPGTKRYRQAAEKLLMAFTEQWVAKKHPGTPASTFLSHEGPSVCNDQTLWLYLTKSLAARPNPMRKNKANPNGHTLASVQQEVVQCMAAYNRLSSRAVTKKVSRDCLQYAECGLKEVVQYLPPRTKESATIADIEHLLASVILNPTVWTPASARERVQLLVNIGIQAHSGARPGETTLPRGYDDALKWGDIDFFVVSGPTDRDGRPKNLVQVDLRFRNRKGHRASMKSPYSQPFYEDPDLPPARDTTLLLVILAMVDGVFQDVTSLAGIYGADLSRLRGKEKRETRMHLRTKSAKRNMFVLRKISSKEDSKMPHPTLTACWDANSASTLIAKVGKLAGFRRLHWSNFRYMVADSLNVPTVTDVDRNLVMGHAAGSKTYEEEYVSKRSKVDFQGLVDHGQPSPERIAPHGLSWHGTQDVDLTDAEKAEVRQDATCVVLEKNHIDARAAVQAEFGSTTAARANKNHPLAKAYERTRSAWRARVEVLERERLQEKAAAAQQALHRAILDGGPSESLGLSTLDAEVSDSEGSDADSETSADGVDFDWSGVADAPEPAALALKAVFEKLSEEHYALGGTAVTVPKLQDLLLTGNQRLSAMDAMDLLIDEAGTRNICPDQKCSSCDGDFGNTTRGSFLRHRRRCFRDKLARNAEVAFAKVWAGRRFPVCSKVLPQHGADAAQVKSVKSHFSAHEQEASTRLTGQCMVPRCTFEVPNADPASLDALTVHYEAQHGLVFFGVSEEAEVEYIEELDQFLVGRVMLAQHRQGRLAKLVAGDWSPDRHCLGCLFDQSASLYTRSRCFLESDQLVKHFNREHLFWQPRLVYRCPVCETVIAGTGHPDHLIAQHKVPLAGKGGSRYSPPKPCNGDLEKLVCRPEDRILRAQWVARVNELQ